MVQADLRALQAAAAARALQRRVGRVAKRAPYTGGLMTTVGVIGLGYVGLPLAVAFAQEGCEVIARRRRLAQGRGDRGGRVLHRGRPLRGAARRSPSRIARRPRATRGWREADAVLMCVPTPLTRNREPDLGPLIDATRALARGAAGRPAGRARVHHLPRHHARAGRAAAGGVGAGGGPRLPPRVLARARGPRPHRLHAAQHAEGGRRADRRVRRARAGAVRAGLRRAWCVVSTPGGGRADEAAGEHLPLGEHRARQRAGDAHRPHGHRHLGGGRRRRDQAVRVHALRARARAWAGTACRSTPST